MRKRLKKKMTRKKVLDFILGFSIINCLPLRYLVANKERKYLEKRFKEKKSHRGHLIKSGDMVVSINGVVLHPLSDDDPRINFSI